MEKGAQLQLPADRKSLTPIRQFIRHQAQEWGITPAITEGILLAVDEAATNIILHGYQEQGGDIEIFLTREGDDLFIHLYDHAPPFDPMTVAPPDMSLPLDQRPIGGMGVPLIRQTMDTIIHRVTPHGGNELTMIKQKVFVHHEDNFEDY